MNRDLELAHEALASARDSVDSGHVRTAINRAYYATFYAARSALAAEGEAPKTHSGVHNRFRLRFVTEGSFDAVQAGVLAMTFSARLNADYDGFSVFDAGATRDLIADAERFVTAVETLLASGDG